MPRHLHRGIVVAAAALLVASVPAQADNNVLRLRQVGAGPATLDAEQVGTGNVLAAPVAPTAAGANRDAHAVMDGKATLRTRQYGSANEAGITVSGGTSGITADIRQGNSAAAVSRNRTGVTARDITPASAGSVIGILQVGNDGSATANLDGVAGADIGLATGNGGRVSITSSASLANSTVRAGAGTGETRLTLAGDGHAVEATTSAGSLIANVTGSRNLVGVRTGLSADALPGASGLSLEALAGRATAGGSTDLEIEVAGAGNRLSVNGGAAALSRTMPGDSAAWGGTGRGVRIDGIANSVNIDLDRSSLSASGSARLDVSVSGDGNTLSLDADRIGTGVVTNIRQDNGGLGRNTARITAPSLSANTRIDLSQSSTGASGNIADVIIGSGTASISIDQQAR